MQKNVASIGEMTFMQGYVDWITSKKNQVKESTYRTYEFKVTKHVLPDLGEKKLTELLNFDFEKYFQEKRNEQKSREYTIKQNLMLIKSILRNAKRKYGINFDLDFSFRTNYKTNDVVIFNDKERQKLIKYLNETTNIRKLGILISLFSGIRIGEVCGLKWGDFDFENKTLQIRRTVERIYLRKNTKVILTSPKSRKSIRSIPLAQTLINILKPISEEYPKDAYILTRRYN